ncbi:UNVERIFIED_CONTAM: hypothetical protein Sindi_2884200 [Sesamum indicum]
MSATYLFMIWQRSDESLQSFIGRFNNETLEVHDLRIDMMTSILKKGPFAPELATDPPKDVEQLMQSARKYIDEEEMNEIKDKKWSGGRDRQKRPNEERSIQPKYRNMPLVTSKVEAMMMVERDDLLQWPSKVRETSVKRDSKKYCKLHRDKRHDTEDSYQLKDEIERLIRQGYFKESILKEGGRDRNSPSRARSRSRSRSQRRGKLKQEGAKEGLRDNDPIKGVIW